MKLQNKMSKLKLQSGRRIDRFKIATSKVLEIANNVSKVGEIQSKIMFDDIHLPEEFNNNHNFTKTSVPIASYDILPNLEDKSIGSVQSSQISSMKTSNPDCTPLTSGESNSSTFKTYKGIKDAKSNNRIIDNLSALYRLHQEKEKSLEELNRIPLQRLQDQFQELASKGIISKRINKIQNLNEHLKKVVLEVAQLKQKLRKPIFQDTWDMQIHHHKVIIQFFEISKALTADLEKNIETYKWIGFHDINKSLDMKPFLVLLHTAIVQLEKYFGSLAEFRTIFSNNFDFDNK